MRGGIGAALALLLLSAPLVRAQVVKPDETDISNAPQGFQDILRGRANDATPATGQRGRPPPLPGGPGAPAPAARSSTGARDLTGIWVAEARGPGPPSSGFAPGQRPGLWVHTKMDVSRFCQPEAAVVQPASMMIFQTPSVITLTRSGTLRVRRIYLNAQHARTRRPSYGGDAVAHWEGDTLVVDTVALKGPLGDQGARQQQGFYCPAGGEVHELLIATPTLHVTERIKKINGGAQLQDEMHFEDSAGAMKPYTLTSTLRYGTRVDTLEDICEDSADDFGAQYNSAVKTP